MDAITQIPLSLLIESPTNPRKTFDAGTLQELADSIRSQGLLQPITVRPVTHSTGYEIVFGHRRFRAAELAGLDQVPCIVRAMTVEQVAMAQLHENLAREDVHPIEEADAFARLMSEHGLTIDQLMAQTGKSRTYIYNRLKLASLAPETRQACVQLGIGAEIATLIARVPAPLQNQAVARCKLTGGDGTWQVLSYRSARDVIARGFTRPLADAPFNPAEHYVNCDGPCTTCPRNTDNEAVLSELGAYVCTDVACYDLRCGARYAERIETARRLGLLIEDAAEIRSAQPLVRACQWDHETGRNFTYADLVSHAAAAGATPVVHTYVDDSGEPVDCLTPDEAQRLVAIRWPAKTAPTPSTAACGASDADDGYGYDDDDAPSQPARTPEEQALIDNWPAIKRALIARVAQTPRTAEDLRLILHRELMLGGELSEDTEDALGWTEQIKALQDAGIPASKARQQLLAGMSPDQMAAALVIDAISNLDQHWNIQPERLQLRQATAARYRINPFDPAGDAAAEVDRDPRVPDMFEAATADTPAEAVS